MFLSYGSQLCVPISPFELTVTCAEISAIIQKMHNFLYKCVIGVTAVLSLILCVELNLTSISEPWMMKERVWFFGTTAWTRGRPSLTTWNTTTHGELSFFSSNDDITTGLFEPTSTKGRSFVSCSKIFRGIVSRRACRLIAFSADMRGGWGSWLGTQTW